MNLNNMNISTEKLVLSGITISDADAMFKYRSDPQIYKFQDWKPETLQEVKEFIDKKIAKTPNMPGTWYQR